MGVGCGRDEGGPGPRAHRARARDRHGGPGLGAAPRRRQSPGLARLVARRRRRAARSGAARTVRRRPAVARCRAQRGAPARARQAGRWAPAPGTPSGACAPARAGARARALLGVDAEGRESDRGLSSCLVVAGRPLGRTVDAKVGTTASAAVWLLALPRRCFSIPTPPSRISTRSNVLRNYT